MKHNSAVRYAISYILPLGFGKTYEVENKKKKIFGFLYIWFL